MTGPEVDLYGFSTPRWNSQDGGKYIGTLGVVIVKDPETGLRNMGIYREQIQGRNKMGLQSTQQVGIILTKYWARGEVMPVVTAIGVEPAILAASCFRLPLGYDEVSCCWRSKR